MERKRLLLITVPAMGHIIPMVELAKRLTPYHDVVLAVSQFRIAEMRKRILHNSSIIQLIGVQDGFSPEDYVCPGAYSTFIAMVYKSEAGIRALVESLQPTTEAPSSPTEPLCNISAVIVDSFVAGAAVAAPAKGIPLYHLITYPAGCAKLYSYLTKDSAFIPDGNAGVSHLMEIPKFDGEPPLMAEWKHKFLTAANDSYPLTTGLIFNTVYELEQPAVDFFKGPLYAHLRLYCVGPIIQHETITPDANQVQAWLDKKQERSVVYVSFGSLAAISPVQTKEMAKALKNLNRPFIWVVPTSQRNHLPDDLAALADDPLNVGNAESKSIILSWAPQQVILRHPATAVFISHCGWNSTLETLTNGIPVVGWPMFAEQLINADFLERKGVGIRVPDTSLRSDAPLKLADEIQGYIEIVLGEGRENTYRKNAVLIAKMFNHAMDRIGELLNKRHVPVFLFQEDQTPPKLRADSLRYMVTIAVGWMQRSPTPMKSTTIVEGIF